MDNNRKIVHSSGRRLRRGLSEGTYLHDKCTIKGSDVLLTAASSLNLANLDSWEAFEDQFSTG